MLPWYSLASAQMANNLIKWWRTKFLNGYKQFSVIPTEFGDGRPSDTEELLGHHHVTGSSLDNSFGGVSAVQLPTCSTPPPNSCINHHHAAETTPNPPITTSHPVPQTPPPTQQHQPPPQTQPPSEEKLLNLEEFSCDVSMEGGIYRDGQERQEFSFTLYDFDGHGKITKDDIAGLVTTIYETLGSSVKVPHYGSKTIKVKLTVSPDQRKRMSATVIGHKSPSPERQPSAKPEDSGVHIKRDLNVTIKDTHRHRRHCRRQQQQQQRQLRQQQQRQQQEEQKVKEHICCNFTSCKETNTTAVGDDTDCDFSDHCSRISEDEMSEDECSEDQILKHPSCEKIRSKRYQKHVSQRLANYTQNTHVPISPVLCTKARRNKKRSSSLQRKELLDIIQANMDKNNHGFQNLRKQCPNHVNIEIERGPSAERKHRHKHKISREKSTAQLQCLANFVNADNCYLNLSTLEGTTHSPIDETSSLKNLPYCRYDKLLGAVVCMSNKQINSLSHSPCRNRRHYHSKSHDLSQMRYHLLEPTNLTCHDTAENVSPRSVKKPNARLKSYEAEFEQTPAAFKKNVKKFPQVVLGHSSSPHYLKHRNRQEDQARAMAQVVRWLEQEFSSNVNMSGSKQENTKKRKCNAKSSPQNSSRESPNREANSPSVSGVERHEHHHVHEHIHHHYHHYQEAPVVV